MSIVDTNWLMPQSSLTEKQRGKALKNLAPLKVVICCCGQNFMILENVFCRFDPVPVFQISANVPRGKEARRVLTSVFSAVLGAGDNFSI